MRIGGMLGWLLLVPAASWAAGERVVEVYNREFYNGLTVTAQKLASGNLLAYVSLKKPDGTLQTVADYSLDVAAATGQWIAWSSDGRIAASALYDYAHTSEGQDLTAIVRAHTVKSVALSAFLLLEDQLAAGCPGGGCAEFTRSCSGCQSVANGCSGWFVADECAGVSIYSACRSHDDCYQCGMFCSGTTRAQCDWRLRQDIYALTNNSWCAVKYWIGARAAGWMFYRDPLGRIPAADVYHLGLFMTACPPGLYHLCTIYVF